MTRPQATQAPGPISLEIVHDSGDWPDVSRLLQDAAAAAWRIVGDGESASISLALMDSAAIRRLNAEFRGKDAPTDVLSFPADESMMPGEDDMLGDIAIAADYVRREAGLENKTFEAHLVHLFIHGLLHLLGHDHEETEQAQVMEDTERVILAQLGIADPYAGRTLEN
ncbi:rRNA maturation RNase YbeY [Minwuia sp.]|uniref:rRNA maturation RNase YbeY n=1 Tax=Minwuia sp. TaxID=2493630 RepID=UPI003A94C44F